MSRIAAATESNDQPVVGLLGADGRHSRDGARALHLISVPLLISATVQGLFFIVYWVPEANRFPGHGFLLSQLWPLASTGLTGADSTVIPAQAGRSSASAAWLLMAALVFPWLARSRYWVARLVLWPVAYLSLIAIAVTLISLAVRGQTSSTLVATVLMVIWAYAAVVTTWRSLWVDPETLPEPPAFRTGLLIAYGLAFLAPLAVGRSLFGGDLRTAAAGLAGDASALRWSALTSSVTIPLYLSGLAVGVALWALAALRPLSGRAWQSLGGPSAARIAAVMLLIGSLVTVGVFGSQGAAAAAERAREISYGDPRSEIGALCGSWTTAPRAGPDSSPARTVVAHGPRCRRLTAFTGYHQDHSRTLTDSMSPLRATIPEGGLITPGTVGARYGGLLVLASTNRYSKQPTRLQAVSVEDLAEVWSFACPGDTPFTIRFAGAGDGDQPAAGRITRRGEEPAIVVGCGTDLRVLEPSSGAGAS